MLGLPLRSSEVHGKEVSSLTGSRCEGGPRSDHRSCFSCHKVRMYMPVGWDPFHLRTLTAIADM